MRGRCSRVGRAHHHHHHHHHFRIIIRLGGHIISDGGCTCPGDVAKAFGAGADFVMMGGMLAGHDQSGGEVGLDNLSRNSNPTPDLVAGDREERGEGEAVLRNVVGDCDAETRWRSR